MKRAALIVALLCSSTAFAQTATMTPQQLIMQQAAGSKGQKLQAALAVGVVLGCTNKAAGRPATEAFMGKLQTIGDATGKLCKAGQKQAARDYVVNNIATVQNDPVLPIMRGCYEQNRANLQALAGPDKAAEFVRYEQWANDPEAAKTQIKPEDICR